MISISLRLIVLIAAAFGCLSLYKWLVHSPWFGAQVEELGEPDPVADLAAARKVAKKEYAAIRAKRKRDVAKAQSILRSLN